jgi:spore germination protein YaaH
MKRPVFHDPQHRRWQHFKRTVKMLSLGLALILSGFLISISINPGLPSLGLPQIHHFLNSHHLLAQQHEALIANFQKHFFPQFQRKAKRYLAINTSASESSLKTERIGFYVNWDDNSFTSLQQNISQLDKLMPEWLHLSQADGAIAVDDLNKQNKALAYIHASRPDLPIVPLINNFDGQLHDWNGAKVAQLLANPTARENIIRNLLEFVRNNNLAGINNF